MARKPKNQALNEREFGLNYIGSKDESPDERTVESRKKIRRRLSDDIQKFLESGGKIDKVKPNEKSEMPKKPLSNYASRPI